MIRSYEAFSIQIQTTCFHTFGACVWIPHGSERRRPFPPASTTNSAAAAATMRITRCAVDPVANPARTLGLFMLDESDAAMTVERPVRAPVWPFGKER
jgi:hypothetical protein